MRGVVASELLQCAVIWSWSNLLVIGVGDRLFLGKIGRSVLFFRLHLGVRLYVQICLGSLAIFFVRNAPELTRDRIAIVCKRKHARIARGRTVLLMRVVEGSGSDPHGHIHCAAS